MTPKNINTKDLEDRRCTERRWMRRGHNIKQCMEQSGAPTFKWLVHKCNTSDASEPL